MGRQSYSRRVWVESSRVVSTSIGNGRMSELEWGKLRFLTRAVMAAYSIPIISVVSSLIIDYPFITLVSCLQVLALL